MWDVVRLSEPISNRGVCFPDIKDEDTPENTKKTSDPQHPEKTVSYIERSEGKHLPTFIFYCCCCCFVLFENVSWFCSFQLLTVPQRLRRAGYKMKKTHNKNTFSTFHRWLLGLKLQMIHRFRCFLVPFLNRALVIEPVCCCFFVCFSLFFTVLGEEKYR